MSSYSKPCIFCKQEIKMSNDSGNWLPYSLDGTLHECRNKQPQPHAQPQNKKQLTLESLDQRIKEIEESFDMRIKRVEAVLFRD